MEHNLTQDALTEIQFILFWLNDENEMMMIEIMRKSYVHVLIHASVTLAHLW